MKATYKKSGVDIQKANIFKSRIKALVRSTFNEQVLKDIGGFGSFYALPKEKFKQAVLVSSSDGVGTKLKIAVLANKHDSIGIDAVAMNVNDILCAGAQPLFFLDYIAYSKLKPQVLYEIIKGLRLGCMEAGCALIGGETAQMPGMYKSGEYDLAGFCVGVVDKDEIIDGSKIEPGNAAIGIASNGLHSNGFSLVRKVLSRNELRRMSKELLKPTRIYTKPILSLLREPGTKNLEPINGIAHITGGAFYDKIERILPVNADLRIKKGSWVVPEIFKLIENKGSIADREMYHTFNMGIGLVLICTKESASALISKLKTLSLRSWIIGEVLKGNKKVEII